MTYSPAAGRRDGDELAVIGHAAALLREVEDDAAPHSHWDGHQVDRSLRHVQHVLQRDVSVLT